MVVDEELKMMSAVCPDGGRIRGPYLKRMSRLTHTEYLLEGRSTLDPREVLRRTMFAPTVTGSPMGNACAVIARHETTARGYYAGVLARFTPRRTGGVDLDAPILIRTAYLDGAGTRAGARRRHARPPLRPGGRGRRDPGEGRRRAHGARRPSADAPRPVASIDADRARDAARRAKRPPRRVLASAAGGSAVAAAPARS